MDGTAVMPMMSGNFRINIEVLDNGYTVEVPDLAELKAQYAKKKKNTTGGYESPMYWSDCIDKKVAKTKDEVLAIVKQSLTDLPGSEYDDAFNEADSKSTKGM